MEKLSYNLSSSLQNSLDVIEKLRQKILLTPLSPDSELAYQWDTTVNRLLLTASLQGQVIPHSQIENLLTTPKHLSPIEKELLGYKTALDEVFKNWLVSNQPVTPEVVNTFSQTLHGGQSGSKLKSVLDYLQSGSENPIIQSATIITMAYQIDPLSSAQSRLTRLLGYLFLAKSGYDFRRLVNLEEMWLENREEFFREIREAPKRASLTLWLEYFAQKFIVMLEKTHHHLTQTGKIPSSRLSTLNERQKEILILLENPNTTITNRFVQQKFHMSQISASRDLAKLATLGLIFSHGHGRSVHYSRT